MRTLRHTRQIALRHLRLLLRRPAFLAITILQPTLWLFLVSEIFRRVVQIPGFHSRSYLAYVTPGIMMLASMSFAVWTGMPCTEDMRSGVMDRLLATCAWRPALTTGSVAYAALMVVGQSLTICLLALAMGAHFAHGIDGMSGAILFSALLGGIMCALSNGIAIIVRERETLIGIVTLASMPLTFMSSAFMPATLLPGWVRTIEKGNPVNWAVEAARSAVAPRTDWRLVTTDAALLAILLIASVSLAQRSLRAYIRSN